MMKRLLKKIALPALLVGWTLTAYMFISFFEGCLPFGLLVAPMSALLIKLYRKADDAGLFPDWYYEKINTIDNEL